MLCFLWFFKTFAREAGRLSRLQRSNLHVRSRFWVWAFPQRDHLLQLFRDSHIFFLQYQLFNRERILNELDLTKISNDYSTVTAILFNIRSDEGLTLKTPALETLYGGQFTLSTQFLKPNYLVWETNKGLRGQERLGR